MTAAPAVVGGRAISRLEIVAALTYCLSGPCALECFLFHRARVQLREIPTKKSCKLIPKSHDISREV
jgi:hypothetical protein